jgi:hypothetical protein
MGLITIIKYLIGGIIVLAVIFILAYYQIRNDALQEKNYEEICKNTCSRFDYTFFRIEDTSTYAHTSHNCWCVTKDNTPIDLGKIE